MTRPWIRTAHTPAFCAVARVSDSVAFAECGGHLASQDVVELDEQPPHGMRCAGCVDALVARKFAEWAVTP